MMPNDGKQPDRAHATHLWVPSYMRRARKAISVVFYVHVDSKRITVGFPDEFPAPKGFDKIVCTTAHEVEYMSRLLRKQEQIDEERTDEEREAFEGPIRRHCRQELQHRMANSHNAINREFCRIALQKLDEYEANLRMKRVSYMHSEAFEDGK